MSLFRCASYTLLAVCWINFWRKTFFNIRMIHTNSKRMVAVGWWDGCCCGCCRLFLFLISFFRLICDCVLRVTFFSFIIIFLALWWRVLCVCVSADFYGFNFVWNACCVPLTQWKRKFICLENIYLYSNFRCDDDAVYHSIVVLTAWHTPFKYSAMQ